MNALAARAARRKETVTLHLPGGETVRAGDDAYSDRVRCDHPGATDGEALGHALLDLARERRRGRVVVLARQGLESGLARAGLWREARIPGFYRGQEDCVVMAAAPDETRAAPADAARLHQVDQLVAAAAARPGRDYHPTFSATEAHAEGIAALIDQVFEAYPTPSDDPEYIAADLAAGTPYRVAMEGPRVVACASADLVEAARTAELTDCATLPEARGKGLMQALLRGLMSDLRARGYPTAFTLCRARNPGINLAFRRAGFSLRGRMTRSCRIGSGLEDMNVWSRHL